MTPVTDPAILAQLNGGGGKPVTDPAILAQLNGGAAPEKSGGSLDSFVRSAANAATFNLADPIAAAVDAVVPIDSGSSKAPSWSERYRENRDMQHQKTAATFAEHPVASIGGAIGGGFINPVARSLPGATSLKMAAAQGAGLGAGYGAGDAIAKGDGALEGLKDTAIGAGTGGVLGAGLHGLGLLLQPAAKTASARALEAEGVNPTIGQMLGGSAQRSEDASTSVPLFGDAIRDRQRSAIHDYNRASYNRVLEPLGLKYAPDAPVGNTGIENIGKLVSKAYDHVFDGAKVDLTHPDITDSGSQLLSEAKSTLTPERFTQFQKNINERINAKLDEEGILSGKDLIVAKNWLAEQARAGATATKDEQAVAEAYGGVLGLLKSGIAATDPDRGALLKAADTAYSRFARVAHAASSNNASGKEGIFTPNQLGTSIRTLETTTRKMGFAKGMAPMQDLAQAGQHTLSQTVPDSGTAMRTVFEHPLASLATAPAWLAGRALYSKTGQKAAKAALFGAPDARKAIARTSPLLLSGSLPLLASPGR